MANQPIIDFDGLCAAAGTQVRLASYLNIHPKTVSLWGRYGIPIKYWEKIFLKYKITPAELYSINQKIKKAHNGKAR